MATFNIPLADTSTFESSNPWLNAIQAVQSLRSAALSNKRKEINQSFLPETIQSQLLREKTLNSLREAKIPLLQQKAIYQKKLIENPFLGSSHQNIKILKTPHGYYRYNMITGESHPITDDSGRS